MPFLSSVDFTLFHFYYFSKFTFLKNSFENTTRVLMLIKSDIWSKLFAEEISVYIPLSIRHHAIFFEYIYNYMYSLFFLC